MNNAPVFAPQLAQVEDSPFMGGEVKPEQKKKEARLSELRSYLDQLTVKSASSFIGKVTYRGYELGISQAETLRLLKNYFRQRDERHRVRWITMMVKGAREMARQMRLSKEASS